LTNVSPVASALNWGGLVPPNGTDCGCVMLTVVALPQLTSVNELGLIMRATSDG
jgi:hypothetical protein